MITTSSYFVGDIEISNIEDTAPNSNLLGNKVELEKIIKIYEPDCLTKSLGYALYALLEAERDETKTNGLKDSADAKWNDLLNGKTYTKDGYPVKFKGIIFKDGDIKRSLIAEYIFHYYLKKNRKIRSGIGMHKAKGKGTIFVDDTREYVDSYNRFYELTVGNCKSIKENAGIRSLYQFIDDMNTETANTYPNWMPYTFPKLNIMGL